MHSVFFWSIFLTLVYKESLLFMYFSIIQPLNLFQIGWGEGEGSASVLHLYFVYVKFQKLGKGGLFVQNYSSISKVEKNVCLKK